MTGALNTRPAVVLRLLTWQSPSLPLGAWIAAAAAGGGALSAAGTALALRDGGQGLRRRVRREAGREEPWDGSAGNAWGQAWRGAQQETGRSEAEQAQGSRGWGFRAHENQQDSDQAQTWRQAAVAGPDRAPGEPPPTVSVPYRVIQRGRSAVPSEPIGSEASAHRQHSERGGWSAPREEQGSAEPVPAADDWGSDALEDW